MRMASMKWVGVSAVLAVLGLLMPGQAMANTVRALEASSEPIHLRVVFMTNPAREAVVSWTTTAEGASHTLYVDSESRDGELSAYSRVQPSQHSAPFTLREDEEEAGMHSWGHHVHLSGLQPATKYYLVAESDGEVTGEHYFVTAPEDDREIRLLFAADSRVGDTRTQEGNYRRQVNALMRELFEAHPDIVAMAHGADYTNRAYWSQLYFWLNDHYEKTTTSDGRLLPIIPSRGNHDLDVGFEEIFWWPNMQNDYYFTTELSSEVALITLNTTISRSGDQLDWMESEIPSQRAEKRWVLFQYHHPAWPSVRAPGSGLPQRQAWVPLFEQHQVDLVMESHDHALKRTVPIFDNVEDQERGVVYIGDGGGGVSPRDPDASRWYLEVVDNPHHAHILHFTDDALGVQAICIDREVRDAFTFTHDRRPEPE